MNRTFEHFHLSLIARQQLNLFQKAVTREDWIRTTFDARFTFRHHGKSFHWVPYKSYPNLVVGTIERKKSRLQHRAPDEGAAEFEGEEWQGSMVIIDPVHHPDGQKIAFELDGDVGRPTSILTSLVTVLNSETDSPYALVVKPLFDADNFRNFAKRHGELMQYVKFSFVVPNMFFGTSTSVDQGLGRMGENTGALTVDLRLQSGRGVKTDSADVTSALAYAEAGNATVTSKAMNGETFSSTRRTKTIKLANLSDAQGDRIKIMEWLLRALGRE